MSESGAKGVAWLEGMFLRPQHLQQQTEYLEERLHQQLRIVDPYHWGVRVLEVDEEQLANHAFVITRLEAVLPSGVLVRYPGNATVEVREFPPTVQSLDVTVGLRLPRPGEANAAQEDEERRDVRYKIRAEPVADRHRGGSAAPVDFLVQNLRTFLPGEELEIEQHESLRIARVVATGDKLQRFALARDFAPPLLAIDASRPLYDEIARVLSLVEARIRVVAGRTTTVSIADLPRMWMRYSLSRAAPVLRHLLGAGVTPPFPLYTALLELAAALGAFRLSEVAAFEPYDHANPYPCFKQVLERIELDLGDALPVRFRELRLGFDRNAYVTKELSLELLDLKNQFFVGVRSGLSKDELLEHVKQTGKVASAEWITTKISQNLAGLPLEQLPGAPTDIAAEPGFEFWRLELRGKENEKDCKRVRDSGSVAVSLGNLKDADVRLYVVTPPGS